ncbi:hypothetical protein OHA25_47395 [Nonomuraea sp. NBC_00507]|uniref:hypothetical protein n=1 Tax=Nonomuraea sp. NBC_00507 TaxID=2976002 RepID=UPI002E190771
MPSPRHDALNRLIRDHLDLPIRLLREVGGIVLPTDAPLWVGPGDLRDRISREMHADTVVFGGPPQDRWFSTIVEVETEMSEQKLQQTVEAAEMLRLETRKPVYVIFITPDPGAARFTELVKISSGCLTITMQSVIVGPDRIPVLTDSKQMAADLLTAALSVMAHGHLPEVTEAFIKLLTDLPADDAASLFGYTIDMAAPQARRLLEETVTIYVPEHSPWAQNLYRKGQAAGREEGREEGWKEGDQQGRAQEKRASVFTVLRFRGIDIPPDRVMQITTCTDLALLEVWLRRALEATHINDLFDDDSESEPRS